MQNKPPIFRDNLPNKCSFCSCGPNQLILILISELPVKVQQELMDICELDIMTFKELSKSVQEAFWEKRYYLKNIPGALPKVLLSAGSWDLETLPELYAMLQTWEKPQPMDILQLFLPMYVLLVHFHSYNQIVACL